MPDVSGPGGALPSAHPNLPATAGLDGFEYRTVAEAGLEYESAEASRIGWGFISLYTLAFISTSLLFLAPLLVTLASKVNSLVGIEQAPNSLAVVTGIAALVAVLPDQVPVAQRGLVSGVPGICVPIASVSGTFLVQLFTGNRLAMFLARVRSRVLHPGLRGQDRPDIGLCERHEAGGVLEAGAGLPG